MFIETLVNGRWRRQTTPPLSPAMTGIDDTTCVSGGTCLIAGGGSNDVPPDRSSPALMIGHDGRWQEYPGSLPKVEFFYGLACATTSPCFSGDTQGVVSAQLSSS